MGINSRSSSNLLPEIPTGHTQLEFREAQDVAYTNHSPRTEIKVKQGGKVDLQLQMKDIEQILMLRPSPFILFLHPSEKYLFLSRGTYEIPSAVVLSWSGSDSIILAPVFQGHH